LLYLVTRAPLHAWVMARFGRHLEKVGGVTAESL